MEKEGSKVEDVEKIWTTTEFLTPGPKRSYEEECVPAQCYVDYSLFPSHQMECPKGPGRFRIINYLRKENLNEISTFESYPRAIRCRNMEHWSPFMYPWATYNIFNS